MAVQRPLYFDLATAGWKRQDPAVDSYDAASFVSLGLATLTGAAGIKLDIQAHASDGASQSVVRLRSTGGATLATLAADGTWDAVALKLGGVAISSGTQILETAIADGTVLARVGGSETITGTWSFNNPVTLGTPTALGHAATKAYADASKLVKDKDLATPPGSPATGDRYIVAASPTGAWVGHANEVAEWNGSAWFFTVPSKGHFVHVEDETTFYAYNGTAWGALGTLASSSTAPQTTTVYATTSTITFAQGGGTLGTSLASTTDRLAMKIGGVEAFVAGPSPEGGSLQRALVGAQFEWTNGVSEANRNIGTIANPTNELRVIQVDFISTGHVLSGRLTAKDTGAIATSGILVVDRFVNMALSVLSNSGDTVVTPGSSPAIVHITNTAAPRTVTLNVPADPGMLGTIQVVKDASGGAGTNNITVSPAGGKLIDGAASKVINSNYGAMRLYWDGTNWFTI